MAMKKAQKVAEQARSATKKVAKKVAKVAKKVRAKAQPIPKGYHIITPSIVVRGAAQAIEFYKKAFGAKERSRMPGPNGKLLHAEIKIGDSIIMLSDEMPTMGANSPQTVGGTSSSLMIYTKNADALFQQAVAAGAKPTMPVADQFWGDRYGRVTDPFGHDWQIATHKEDLTPKEMAKRAAAMFSSAPPQK
jgi:uncharacterized glyoxalase superfamily protein PhnB